MFTQHSVNNTAGRPKPPRRTIRTDETETYWRVSAGIANTVVGSPVMLSIFDR